MTAATGMGGRMKPRRLAAGTGLRRVDLSARVAPLPSPMERGNQQRAVLYAAPRWRASRRRFLTLHPVCITPGCGKPATVVDHRDGHQTEGWLARFWDESRWQPMCPTCHAVKSRAELASWRQTGEGGPGGQMFGGSGANNRRGPSRESGPTPRPFWGRE